MDGERGAQVREWMHRGRVSKVQSSPSTVARDALALVPSFRHSPDTPLELNAIACQQSIFRAQRKAFNDLLDAEFKHFFRTKRWPEGYRAHD